MPFHPTTVADQQGLPATQQCRSEHPVGRAVVDGAHQRGLVIPAASAFEAMAGHGVRATVDGRTVWVGSRKLMAGALTIPAELEAAATGLEANGHTAFLVGW